MIASWIGYALVVGLLVSLAAFAAERALLLGRKPVRRVWAGALLLSLLVPALSPLLPWHLPLPALPVLTSIPDPSPGPAEIGVRNGVPVPMVSIAEPGWGVNKALLFLWGASSGVLALFLVYAMGVLQGRRREWRRASVDGVPVLLSRDVGPAVIGWRRLDIVLPEWVHDLAEPARALILRHEMEHVSRQDPRLLLRGFLVVVAMPWNPAAWFQLGRLRRAIELDCDARVVASGADVARYGSVLLDAVGRCNRGGLPAFAAFAERPGDLEARINALTSTRPGTWRSRALIAATAAMALGAAACLMPDSLAPELRTQLQHAKESSFEGIEWVREMLKGHPPADIVVLYRSPDGRLLGSEMMASPAPGVRPQRVGPSYMEEVPTNSIESIEVVRGPALGVPGIDGVIVITLNAVTVESKLRRDGSEESVSEIAKRITGPGGRIVRGARPFIWLRTDTTGTSNRLRVMP
jgi:beta-lactamase regulating signal transducer with metallopeptidase domain